MIRNNRFRPSFETLEDRSLPATMSLNSVLLQNGVLNIAVDPNKAHTIAVSQPTSDSTQVVLDKVKYTFTDAVTQVNYRGGNKGDLFSNLTSIGGTLKFGAGNDVVYSKASGQVITGGAGNNFIQDQAGGNVITVGDGNNNVYGGAGDTISIGSGKNIVYDILGANTVNIAPHSTRNFIFSNASSIVNGANANDRVAVFFAANRTPGTGSLIVENGVLYFTANNNGNQFTLNQVGNKLVAIYNLNDGNGYQKQVFNKSDVKLIANFGGSGNDTLINNTSIPDVQYGAGGTNLLIGGFGELNLEKAGGSAGNSVAIGRSPVINDLNGSGSAASTAVLIVNPFAQNVIRTNNPDDTVIGALSSTVYIGPFKLRGKNGAVLVTA